MSEQENTVFVMDSEVCDCGAMLDYFGLCPVCDRLEYDEDMAYNALVGEYEYENYLILIGVYDE